MSFVFSIRNRERSKVKKGSKNYSLLPQRETGRNTILKVNVRYIKPGELDHVSSLVFSFSILSVLSILLIPNSVSNSLSDHM